VKRIMKRWKKICLGVLLFLVVGVAGVAVWQKENLKALYTYLTNDSQSISQNLEDKRQQQQEALNKDYNVTVQAPSTEQSDDLLEGKVDPEEVKESLGLKQETEKKPAHEETPDKSGQAEAPDRAQQPEQPVQPPQVPEEKDPQQEIEALVNQCVAELYACEVDLMAQLGVMKQAALDEWRALPEEQRTKEKKLEIGFAGLEKCYDLEVVIDDKVEGILEKYRVQIKELGGDTAVLDDLWKYYCEKKAAEKAYYMDKYLG